MTLSRWLRDYLYIPLGGSRKGRGKTYRNLLLTMVLGGLWHGASATFIAWGLFHGLGLAVERWIGERRAARGRDGEATAAWWAWPGRLLTFNLVCVGWVLFRADSFDDCRGGPQADGDGVGATRAARHAAIWCW